MLPKKYRLPAYLIPAVLKNGKKFYCQNLIIFILKNKKPYSRVCFIVPLKVNKRAVKRNRLKRVLRNNYKKQMKDFKANNDIILLAKPCMPPNIRASKKNELNQMREDFKKANLIDV